MNPSLSTGDGELRSSPVVVLSCFTPKLQFPPRTWLLQYSYHVGYPTIMPNQMLFLQNLDIPICLRNSLKALFFEHPLTYHPVQEGTLSSTFNHTFKGNFSMGFKGKLSFPLRPCFFNAITVPFSCSPPLRSDHSSKVLTLKLIPEWQLCVSLFGKSTATVFFFFSLTFLIKLLL